MYDMYDIRGHPSTSNTNAVQERDKQMPYPMEMRWLRGRLVEIGKTGADFARALQIPTSRVYEMIAGKRRLQPTEVGRAARFLDMTEAELVARLEGLDLSDTKKQDEKNVVQIGGNNRQPYSDITERPLVLYRTVLLDGRRGSFMLHREPTDEVPRPFFLKFSHQAFAIKVQDDANYPMYRRWDTLIIDPGGSTVTGEDHLFTQDLDPDGVISVIGCLKHSTGSHWIVHHYGTKQDQELAKAEFPRAWPIVAKYHRR
jgi:plasmid maintenance system antidote protein VapI